MIPPVDSAETFERGTVDDEERGEPSLIPWSLSELIPRMLIRVPPPPGEPDWFVTDSPDICPCRRDWRLGARERP